MTHDLKIVDKAADTWFINTAAFRMVDPTTGHFFEPGVKYKIAQSDWMASQDVIKSTDEDAEVEVLQAHQPGDQVQKMADAADEVTAATKARGHKGAK